MDEPVKRGPGRPKKVLAAKPVEEAVPRKSPFADMKAKPNWEVYEATGEDTPDKLKIDPSLIPEGVSLQWVLDSTYGRPETQFRGQRESRGGWTPVHQSDFGGRFDGMFMRKGDPNEINVGGLVLMARPAEMTKKAKALEGRQAREQIAIKEQALRGGDIPVSLDARHPSAVNTNRIGKSFERLPIPEE